MSLISNLLIEGKVYLLIYLWLFILVVLECCKEYKKYKIPVAVSTALLLTIFTGIRWETGTDWPAYSKLFETLEFNRTFLLNSYSFDLGYMLLNALVKLSTNNYTVFLLFDSFVAVGLVFFFIKKFSPNPNLSLFVFYNAFFVSQFMGSNRRIIALGLILFSFYTVFSGQNRKYSVIYILGGLFHSSAFLTIISKLTSKKRFRTTTLLYILLLSLVVGLFQLPFKLLGAIGNLLSNFSGTAIVDRLAFYSGNQGEIEIGNTNPVVIMTLSVIKRSIFLILYLLIINKKKDILDPLTDFFFNIYIVGFAIYMLLNGSLIFQMISTYFTFIEIALIGRMWEYADRSIKLRFLVILMIYGFFQLLSSLNAYPELYLPYKTFLTN